MVAEDDTESRAFVENRGFEIRVRFEQSGFHTHKTLPADAIARLAQVQASGIEILDGDGLANRFPDDWRERWWRLNEESRVDMTGPDQQEARTYEKFARIFRLPGFARDLFHFAVDGDEVVGLTGLKGHPADLRFVHVFMTGVARSHRRRGLATALKTRSLQLAVERGFDLVKTENEESNQTYQINLALGFEALPASLLYGAQVSTLR
jgi:GNAT superfamily N-acetyltransferase